VSHRLEVGAFVATAALFLTPGHALRAAAAAGDDACAAAQTQLEITECHGREFQRMDHQLNEAYRPLLAALDPEHQEKLKVAQRAWVTFRDADCALDASQALHGSLEGTLLYMCKTSMTKDRIAALANIKKSLADYMH
jgi:uncharacterized protein YecT (DUF1311 family)